jgi:hypothetical protein
MSYPFILCTGYNYQTIKQNRINFYLFVTCEKNERVKNIQNMYKNKKLNTNLKKGKTKQPSEKLYSKMETSTILLSRNNEVVDYSYMEFHTKTAENTNSTFLVPFAQENTQQVFGTLTIKVNDTPMTKTPQYILFMLDRSQSMTDEVETNSTKMEHAKHTIKNIVKLIVNSDENCPPVFIEVYVFDDEVEEVLPKIQITKENMTEILQKIKSIEPRNSTNIELALEKTREIMETDAVVFDLQTVEKTEIFLTDGLPTAGDTNISRLIKKQIEKSKTARPTQTYNNHIYIGYGEDHNGNLLQSISFSKKNGYYYFVDKIENAGLIFGEIMHGLLYPALKHVNIKIQNGEIYDYKTNTWSSNLYVSSILSESEKVYHIRCNNTDDIEVNVTAINAVTNEDFKHTIERLPSLLVSENIVLETDLTKYILRQKTQEYLYHARSVSVSLEDASNTMVILSKHTKKEISDKMQKLREEMKSFLEFLQDYIKSNSYTSDKFFIMLYEDIYIAYKTFGTIQGAMYTGSRQSSQGRQTSYVVSSQPNTPYDNEDDDEPLIFNKLNIKTDMAETNHILSVNTTPKQLKVMSSINSRSSSPPLLSSNDIKLEDMKPLTELDAIMLFNRRNVIN